MKPDSRMIDYLDSSAGRVRRCMILDRACLSARIKADQNESGDMSQRLSVRQQGRPFDVPE